MIYIKLDMLINVLIWCFVIVCVNMYKIFVSYIILNGIL